RPEDCHPRLSLDPESADRADVPFLSELLLLRGASHRDPWRAARTLLGGAPHPTLPSVESRRLRSCSFAFRAEFCAWITNASLSGPRSPSCCGSTTWRGRRTT